MPSTPWHPARLIRASLLLAALALVLVVPGAAAHVACEHADDGGPDQHRCAVCRHLDDGSTLLTAEAVLPAPSLVASVALPPGSEPTGLLAPPACGRSPPAHVSVS